MNFNKIAKTALIFVYLVIIAGALVRMTGSGMGCPDWPKCFGYYIPPTDIKELTWAENRVFKKGMVIIKDEALFVAKEDCLTGKTFDASQWEPYTKHDYAIFNPLHTWVEYGNRLVGALAGLACFIMAVASFRQWKKNKKITLLSWLVVFLMGFQGWLGATVVYSVLNPLKITIHMVMALVIVAFILYIIHLANPRANNVVFNPMFRNILWITLILTLVQVVLGTQVRQFVDEQVKSGVSESSQWLSNPEISFYFHRTFSIVVFLANLFLYLRNKRFNLGFGKINWVMLLLLAEIVSGMAMYYIDFPFGSQAIHLVLASILFGIQFYMILEAKKQTA
ncbi:COX15/CtaA family protein [Flavobacterium amniphilum]|uniref:COX15/CtaA family protein n=1 Tax=Flavobacterium amniphilum TaxID=1834035 RepID=UPI00202A372C|nr:COX15/CtaA family protein [Flavobacterium amniphilum]MCL9805690.1 COX15/CtaA family protein [Flavobacterium amniphilum]